MEATITLPDGKELIYRKGEKGVDKMFLSKETGALVIVTKDETLSFINYPIAISYQKEIE